ncbi:phage Mu protein gp47-like protein [Paenibacillus sp. A3]|uniref:baseplate J/gp47 family protein n=1 Tax=Paenibacillus sp. A3 TaxID=1337054 RepID=UPI0006D52A8C|nr:baseplate J/gp47 family protein [Paenibacillus sp. A3]KPV60712.1 phage Mu protein gp47-like protein [Paenibacillus sp. A3]
MPYFAPYIDAAGLHIPAYTDIRDQLVADAKRIFGQDIYLGEDSQDYQWISAVANIIYDSFLASQAAYNSRGPGTAIGSALDVIVKLNGIKRQPAVYSTCYVTLTGTPSAMITNGVVGDTNGHNWSLTSPILLDATGRGTALATCQTPGPIAARPGEIRKIVTPTYGWSSVTNAEAAKIGTYAESDAQLRARQAISTAQPSKSMLEGVKGAIAAVPGVTRFVVYENDTSVTDTNGLPAHSITIVVEGGEDSEIAKAIYIKKTIGCYTNGSTEVIISDAFGMPVTERFYRPTYVDIDVTVNVKKLPGYTTQTTDDMKSSIVSYINSLLIGDNLSVSSLWGAALLANEIPNKPSFSITSLTAGKHGQTQGASDITILYNEVTRGRVEYITVNVT